MTDVLEDIKQGFRQFNASPHTIIPALVIAVNDDHTVEVEFNSGAKVDDVRLKSVVKEGDHVLLIPKLGSTVLVGRIEGSDEFVMVAVEEITEEVKVIGTTKVQMDAAGLLIKRGTEDLLTLMHDLIDACINERHQTNTGVSVRITPNSEAAFLNIKSRFANLLKSS